MVEQVTRLAKTAIWKLRWEILARPFVRHVGVLTVANGVGAALSVVQGILVARWLGPELYGVAALVMSYPNLLYGFVDARSTEATVKYLSRFHARHERERAIAMCQFGYGLDLAIASLVFIASLLTAPWATRTIIHRPEVMWLILLYATAFLPAALRGTSYAVLATFERFPLIAGIELVTAIVRLGLVFALLLVGLGVTGVIFANATALALSGMLYGFFALSCVHAVWGAAWGKVQWSVLRSYRREILRFLGFNDLTVLVATIPKRLDVPLLGYFGGTTEVGYYRLAQSIAGVVAFLISPLQSVLYRRFVAVSDSPVKLLVLSRRVIFQIAMPLSLLNLLGIFMLPWLSIHLVGRSYGPSVVPMQLWVIAYSVWFLFVWLRPLYVARGWLDYWLLLNIIGALVFVVLSIPLTVLGGFIGLTAARIAFPIVVHLSGILVLRPLMQRALKEGWTTKAGMSVKLLTSRKTCVKVVEFFNVTHRKFVESVVSLERLRPYFPPVVRLFDTTLDSSLGFEWVKGHRITRVSPELITQIATFQAILHNQTGAESDPGFDYVRFIVDRGRRMCASAPQTLQHLLKELTDVVLTPSCHTRDGISYPDMSPGNIVWVGGMFRIVDVELLTRNKLYLIDLFNTCSSFNLRGSAIQLYVEAYKRAGGELSYATEQWEQLMALWALRVIGAARDSNEAISRLQRIGRNWRSVVSGFEPELLEATLRCR